ncbi:MAG: asparagine synthase (glutamine-hydrolyzing) [Gemmatimonadetes bacterium]|nr:asparagine synthase (glutamine-hydrolyzing) [Gemmatimonadota bacterium]
MCGVAGWIGGPQPRDRVEEAVRRLTHRGPDDVGVEHLATPAGEAWLGFRRLALQDPSLRGRQPMADASGRWRIVFNGEVYNFPGLRRELEARGRAFRTGTDTEVLVEGWAEWGEALLPRLVGMFAFAILDTLSGDLTLVRDRLGIKPLYWTRTPAGLGFASEIKALLAFESVERRVDPVSLARYLTFLWVPAPGTLLEGVRQLEPGTLLRVRGGEATAERWWDVPLPLPGRNGRGGPGEAEAVERLDGLLREAVRDRLISDVPLGAFLSGGVDSSLVVALMRLEGAGRVTTETVAFPADDRLRLEAADAPWARRVRDHFDDLDYREHELTPDVAGLLPRMVWHLDDPVADPAALSTYLICTAARERATVMLAGMGAEELFAGYGRHRATLLAERYRRVPRFLRRGFIEPMVQSLPAARPGPFMSQIRNAKKFVGSAGLEFEDRYLGFSGYYGPDELPSVLGGAPAGDPWGVHRGHLDRSAGLHPVDRMTHLDLNTFLPSLNLAYTDRASMAASVEVRVPLLDHRVVEYVTRLPPGLKLGGSTSKRILKAVAARYLPQDVVHRPKAGFSAPHRSWVQGELKPLIHALLAPERIRARGLLDPDGVWSVIRAQWEGREDNAFRIWAFLTLELWAVTFLDGDGGGPVSV